MKIAVAVFAVVLVIVVGLFVPPLFLANTNPQASPEPSPTPTPSTTMTPSPTPGFTGPTGTLTASPTPLLFPTGTPALADAEEVEADVFNYINEERTNRSLAVLLYHENLTRVAREWSEEIASTGNFTHGDYEGRMQGVIAHLGGEVLAMAANARQAVDLWLGSPEHSERMLSSQNEYMGVGVSRVGFSYIVVVDFGFT